MWIRGSFLGLTVLDRDGEAVGRIEETYPCDGSSPELAVIRAGRFGGRSLVALHGARRIPLPPPGHPRGPEECIQVPYSREDIVAAPTLDGGRYMDDQIWAARAYWGTHRPEYEVGYDRIAADRDD